MTDRKTNVNADMTTGGTLIAGDIQTGEFLPTPHRFTDDALAQFGERQDYRPTAYGLAQAVGRLAQDTDDADTASDLERLAGSIMSRPEAYAVA